MLTSDSAIQETRFCCRSILVSSSLKSPLIWLYACSICDLQVKFRDAIHEFPAVLSTASKLLRASQALDFPVVATTQLRSKLGETVPELGIDSGRYPVVADVDKSAFSMWIPEVTKALDKLPKKLPDPSQDSSTKPSFDIILVGIETHICVLQTTLDALRAGHRVYVVQDGVSSCNPEERGLALERMRQEGARITTSESLLYECLGDSLDPA